MISLLRKSVVSATLLSSVTFALAVSPPTLRGTGGAVSSAAPSATKVGLEVLASGGNAVDASVAVALALAVSFPQAGNLGGGGFAVLRTPEGELTSLDFREVAPARATRDMYLDESGAVDRRKAWVGPLASGVPGSPAGLFELHRRFGVLDWHQVVDPAIALAAEGFVVPHRLVEALEGKSEILLSFPDTAAVFYRDGVPVEAGSILRQPALARTLEAYRDDPEHTLRDDDLAVALVADIAAAGGIIELSDLEAYRPIWRDPVRFEAFGWEFASMGLPSSGGIILGTTLGIAERLGWKNRPEGAERVHLLAEIWRRAFADRVLLGDPETTVATATQLLDEAWLAGRAGEIDRHRATPSTEVGDIADQWLESAATTHLSVVDVDGFTVALTTTLNGYFGSGFRSSSTGIFMNNEMDDFSSAPGQANAFGLIQGDANAIRPGRRMLSSMTPTVAWREGRTLAIGSPGGSRIPTATAQALLWMIADGVDMREAVSRSRAHHQWLPDRIYLEPRTLTLESTRVLQAMGHEVKVRGYGCEVNVVGWFADGSVEAAGDPRGPSVPGVVTLDPAAQ